jgi:hypothetical protein
VWFAGSRSGWGRRKGQHQMLLPDVEGSPQHNTSVPVSLLLCIYDPGDQYKATGAKFAHAFLVFRIELAASDLQQKGVPNQMRNHVHLLGHFP